MSFRTLGCRYKFVENNSCGILEYQQIIACVSSMLPQSTADAAIAHLVLQSSFVDFAQENQIVFKQGDPSVGFYWILDGEVIKDPNLPHKKIFRKSDFVGFEEFRNKISHHSNYTNTKPTKALFIDAKSYLLLMPLLGNSKSKAFLAIK